MTKFSRKNPSPQGDINRYIKVKNDFIGFHTYEDAPDKVAFLRNSHRHKFYVQSEIEVAHEDRELEFFIVQEHIETGIIPFVVINGLESCEVIAEDIMWGLINSYGSHRYYAVTVSEDGENSAQVEWVSHIKYHR